MTLCRGLVQIILSILVGWLACGIICTDIMSCSCSDYIVRLDGMVGLWKIVMY